MKKHGPNVWVVRDGRKYSVKEEGARRPFLRSVTQGEAIVVARIFARANRSELIVQNRRGRIRAKDSHGFDAFPPRG